MLLLSPILLSFLYTLSVLLSVSCNCLCSVPAHNWAARTDGRAKKPSSSSSSRIGIPTRIGSSCKRVEGFSTSNSQKLTYSSATKYPDIPAHDRHHPSNQLRSAHANSSVFSLDTISRLAYCHSPRESGESTSTNLYSTSRTVRVSTSAHPYRQGRPYQGHRKRIHSSTLTHHIHSLRLRHSPRIRR